MGFLGIKNKGRRKLIFNIGSSEINGALVFFRYGFKPDIERRFKSENIILPEVDLRRLWRRIEGPIDKIMRSYKEITRKADEALVVFSSPWYYSEIYPRLDKFDSPRKITGNYAQKIIDMAEDDFKKQARAEFGLLKDDLAFTRSQITGAKINGYSLKQPGQNISGKFAKEIFLSVYTSAFFSKAAIFLKNAFLERGIKTLEFQSSPWIFFEVLSKDGQRDVSVVEIGGEITDIIMIKEGEMRKIASFGRGYNYIVRRLASVLRLGLDEAASTLSAYEENKLDRELKESVNRSLEESIKEWAGLFKETVEKQMLPDLMPEKIILTGGAEISEFSNTLNSSSLNIYTSHGRSFLRPEKTFDLMEFCIKYAQYAANQ
ncbi:MAG: hypothetical protein HYW09_00960 [Candidatus Niyogibacteria bacterium]|nr:hypothetical protein [Candidatus Niyogibacteria bacterium]